MRAHAFFTAGSVNPSDASGSTAVVVDVIRATSTMVTAFGNGAEAVYPTISTEDALRLASSLGRDETLLCGERKGRKIEGFDLGNSPAEYERQTVEGKRLVMSTTNGTRAFLAASTADRVLAASFLNLSAVTEAALESLEDSGLLVVVCAGKEDRFSLDDAVCAGCLLREVSRRSGGELETNDSAAAAFTLSKDFAVDEAFLRSTAAGRALVDIGLDSDLSLCARRDVYELVPEMTDRVIRVAGS